MLFRLLTRLHLHITIIKKKTLWPSWLRRRPAKPLGYTRTGSNPVGVVVLKLKQKNKKNLFIFFFYFLLFKFLIDIIICVWVPVAQWIRRETTNLEIAGSNPAGDVYGSVV